MVMSELPLNMSEVNMSNDYAAEIEAIKVVLTALDALPPEARNRVVKYAITTLGIQFEDTVPASAKNVGSTGGPQIAQPPDPRIDQAQAQAQVHIKELTEKKKPRSANEMAAIVAFYLANSVAADHRKSEITTKDLETYFKIAGFPLPGQLKMTLTNAANAGYFDAVGNGSYKLNAIGYNLVVHSMPRGDANRPKIKQKRKIAKKQKPAK